MAENPTMAFLQQALSVSGANAPVEETALYNLFMMRLIVAGLTIDASGNITAPFITANPNVTNATGTLAVTHGGTGVVSPTVHGVLIGEGASPVTPLVGTTGQVLKGVTGADPAFAQVALTTDVTGTLPVANGGTGVGAGGAVGTVPTGQGVSSALAYQANDNRICLGRLTLTTVTPVTTADVTAATSVFWTPYAGNRIALYDGAAGWNIRTFSELTLAVPATTSQMYDVFIFDNAGTAAIEALAWTNDTTRATALVLQDGVLSKSGALTRRYVGSFRTTTVSGQTEDSATKRFVWNYYNRVQKHLTKQGSSNWTYTTATWRQANADVTNQVETVHGFADTLVSLRLVVFAANSAGGAPASAQFGLDSTTTPNTSQSGSYISMAIAALSGEGVSILEFFPAIGYHKYVWLEESAAIGTTTWFGAATFGAGGQATSGIYGSIWC